MYNIHIRKRRNAACIYNVVALLFPKSILRMITKENDIELYGM